MESNGTSTGTILLAMLGGAVVGAGAALLYAPQSGRRTRQRLQDLGEDATQCGRDFFKSAEECVANATAEAKEVMYNAAAEAKEVMHKGHGCAEELRQKAEAALSAR